MSSFLTESLSLGALRPSLLAGVPRCRCWSALAAGKPRQSVADRIDLVVLIPVIRRNALFGRLLRDDLVQPIAQAHARSARSFLRDLSRFSPNSPDAPSRGLVHFINRRRRCLDRRSSGSRGALNFGLCVPTMKFEAGLDGRAATESTFQAQDPLVNKGQEEALNPAIIANRIHDQLTNVCGANQAAKDATAAAQALIVGLGTREGVGRRQIPRTASAASRSTRPVGHDFHPLLMAVLSRGNQRLWRASSTCSRRSRIRSLPIICSRWLSPDNPPEVAAAARHALSLYFSRVPTAAEAAARLLRDGRCSLDLARHPERLEAAGSDPTPLVWQWDEGRQKLQAPASRRRRPRRLRRANDRGLRGASCRTTPTSAAGI